MFIIRYLIVLNSVKCLEMQLGKLSFLQAE